MQGAHYLPKDSWVVSEVLSGQVSSQEGISLISWLPLVSTAQRFIQNLSCAIGHVRLNACLHQHQVLSNHPAAGSVFLSMPVFTLGLVL